MFRNTYAQALYDTLWSSSPVAGEADELAFLKPRYISNPVNNDLIKREIVRFNSLKQKLVEKDHMLEAIESLNVFAWLAGYSHWLLMAAGSGLMYMFAAPVIRKDVLVQYEAQLKKLQEIYSLCGKDATAEITFNETFCELLAAIAPVTELDKLNLWKNKSIAPDRLSDRFCALLANEPHKVDLRMQGGGSKKTWSSIFSQASAELHLKMYALTTEEDKRENPVMNVLNGAKKLAIN